MKAAIIIIGVFYAAFTYSSGFTLPEYDAQGRRVLMGPLHLYQGQQLDNVHIVSNSYGVKAEMDASISNSVIEAPICVITQGLGLKLTSNHLLCDLAIKFTGTALFDNQFIDNIYSGAYTNRSDLF